MHFINCYRRWIQGQKHIPPFLCLLLHEWVDEKEDAKEFKDKPLKDFVDEVWLSVLDGALNPKDRNSTYYRLVLSVASVPSKLKKNSKNAKKLIKAADYALTGGDINNQSATI